MKHLTTILLLFFITSACTIDKPIEFRKIDDVKVLGINNNKVNIEAKAYFHNPNSLGGRLKNVDIDILFKDKKVANINEQQSLKIPGNSDFTVPLIIAIGMEEVQKNMLSNLISILGGRSMTLQFKGFIKVSSRGIGKKIPIEYTEKINF